MNYFVPNFGQDSDISDTFSSLRLAEEQKQHHWDYDASKFKKEDPILYDFQPELAGGIKTTIKNMHDAENRLGTKWVLHEDD